MTDLANLMRQAAAEMMAVHDGHKLEGDLPEWARKLEAAAQEMESADPVAESKEGNLFWTGNPKDWRGFNGPLFLYPPATRVPEGMVAVHDTLLMLSTYPDDYPIQAMKGHLEDLRIGVRAMLAAPEVS